MRSRLIERLWGTTTLFLFSTQKMFHYSRHVFTSIYNRFTCFWVCIFTIKPFESNHTLIHHVELLQKEIHNVQCCLISRTCCSTKRQTWGVCLWIFLWSLSQTVLRTSWKMLHNRTVSYDADKIYYLCLCPVGNPYRGKKCRSNA